MPKPRTELEVAKAMALKGYRYIVQLMDSAPIGDPLYVKTSKDLSDLMQKEFKHARIKWQRKIDDFIREEEKKNSP